MGMLPPSQPPLTDVTSSGTSYPGNRPADWRKSFVIWIGALATLWFILTALSEAGYTGIARALAGLLVVGALIALGPGAITQAQQLGSS